MATTTANEVTLRIEVATVDVSSWGYEPDPAWRYVDAAGHGHFYDKGYPTLLDVTEPMVDDDGEEWQRHVRWECPHCGENVVPGKRSSLGNSTVPGMKRYYRQRGRGGPFDFPGGVAAQRRATPGRAGSRHLVRSSSGEQPPLPLHPA